tara:strand:- start:11096 stop:11488 length:393 start_codon:yes stop_codon:yes gene_type:complete
MKIYKVKYEREQGGKKLDWYREELYTGNNPPQKGKSKALMTTPVTYEKVIDVEDITVNLRESLTELNLYKIEQTRKAFFEIYGTNPENNRKLFIDWYIKTHQASYHLLINDLSEFYLHISEDRIMRYLNE